jgi:RNA polymerase sigma-70 factor (ECF subfamily)
MRALEDAAPRRKTDLIIRLFSILTQIHREMVQDGRLDARATGNGHLGNAILPIGTPTGLAPKPISFASYYRNVSTGLSALKIEEREALLLVVVEGLDYEQAARILRISPASLIARLGRARHRLENSLVTSHPMRSAHRSAPHLRLVK